MADRDRMSVPQGELTRRELCDQIMDWATQQGLECLVKEHASEFAKVTVHDPDGGHTATVIPNVHKGRRLKKHQIRYVIKDLNKN